MEDINIRDIEITLAKTAGILYGLLPEEKFDSISEELGLVIDLIKPKEVDSK